MLSAIYKHISLLWGISRPHFWLYEAGTFFLGVIAAAQYSDVSVMSMLIWGVYFLIPANVLIYGVNDVFDYETDRLNPKKQTYESVLPKDKHSFVLFAVAVLQLPFLFLLPTVPMAAGIALGVFLFCATFYSAKPIRAKAVPFLDSLFSAGHYVATGVFGFLLFAPLSLLNWYIVLAAMTWAIAMHVYSAVPDITADRSVGLATTATLLRQRRALYYCSVLYVVSAVLVAEVTLYVSCILLVPYLIIMYASLTRDELSLLRLYRVFPYLNAFVGFVLSVQILLRLL
jgi:4-hydroxybenzoate polyprenyltransferase